MSKKNKQKQRQPAAQPQVNQQHQGNSSARRVVNPIANVIAAARSNKAGKALLERLLFQDENNFTPITIEDVIKQLSMGGYHRARVMQLSNYDKIVGGVICLASVFQPVCRGLGTCWIFDEDEPDSSKKSVAHKRKEVNQLLEVLEKIGCPFKPTQNDFVNLNASSMAHIVGWLLPKVTRAALEKKYYQCFLGCFNNTYEDPESAAIDFIKSLRRRNETQLWDFQRFDLFDLAIIRDKVATGKIILAEYNYYARTSSTKYPCFCPGGEEGEEYLPGGINHTPEEHYEDARQQLDEMGTKTFEKLADISKTVATQLYTLIEDFKLAAFITKIEARFVSEAAKYYEMYLEFNQLSDHYQTVQPVVDHIKKTNLPKLTEHVENMLTDAFLLEDEFHKQLKAARDLEAQLRSNRDENGRLRNFCRARQAEANKQARIGQEIENKIKASHELKTELGASYKQYLRFCEARDTSEPNPENENMEPRSDRQSGDIDVSISDDITIMLTKINKSIAEVELMLSPVEKADLDLRKAFLAYATDATLFLSDWYWKAKFLKEERRDMIDVMDRLKRDIQISRHKIHYGKLEVEKLMQVNTAFRKMQLKHALWKPKVTFLELLEKRKEELVNVADSKTKSEGGSSSSSSSSSSSNTITFTLDAEDIEAISEASSNGTAKESILDLIFKAHYKSTNKAALKKNNNKK